MEGIVPLRASSSATHVFSLQRFPNSPLFRRTHFKNHFPFNKLSFSIVKAQQFELKEEMAATLDSKVSERDALKELEVGMFQDEVAASQDIKIRRPPTRPPLHYLGPFESRLLNEGNTPINILELHHCWHLGSANRVRNCSGHLLHKNVVEYDS